MKSVKVGDVVLHGRKVVEVEAISGPGEATVRVPGTNNWYPVAVSELEPAPVKKPDGGTANSDSSSEQSERSSAGSKKKGKG